MPGVGCQVLRIWAQCQRSRSPPALNFTPRIEAARSNTEQCIALLGNLRLLICMGSRLSLSMAVSTCPGVQQLQAVTTEREALALLEQGPVDVLHCTDVLEQGRGDSLVQEAKRRWPPPRTLPACPPDVGGSVFPVRLLEGDVVQVQGDRLHLRCQARGRMSARFVQATDPGVQLEEGNPVEVAVKDGVAELETRLLVRAQDADGHALASRGVLLLGDGPRDPCVWVERKLPVQAIPPGAAP